MPTINPKECRNCGKEFTPRRLSTEVVCSYGCAIAYAKAQREEKEKKEEEQGLRINMEGKPKNKRVAFPELYEKENRKDLQIVVNRIVRLIDKGCKCIDCDRTQSKQWDAGHYKSKGAHPALAFNLHNIFQQSGNCNYYSEGRKGEYFDGLVEMYGQHYADYVEGLSLVYPKSDLTAADVPGVLKEARCIERELKKLDETYPPKVRIRLREEYNQRLGIYLKNPYIAPV